LYKDETKMKPRCTHWMQ